MSLISILEAGGRDFLEATSGLTEDVRPRTGWSVVECIEHVIIAEERYLEWISGAIEIVPTRDAEKEIRLFTMIRSRLTKFETPEVLQPRGRFKTLDGTIAEFQRVRGRSVQVAPERGEGIYAVGVTHPYFGEMNGAELIQLMDGHARRHADQIREVLS